MPLKPIPSTQQAQQAQEIVKTKSLDPSKDNTSNFQGKQLSRSKTQINTLTSSKAPLENSYEPENTQLKRISGKNNSIFKEDDVQKIFSACVKGDIPIIREYIHLGLNINQTIFTSGETLLHIATLNNQFDLVQFLLQSGADVSLEDRDGFNAISIACIYEKANVRILDLLVSKGASLDHIFPTQEPLLMMMCRLDYTDKAEYLINHGANLNVCDRTDQNRTPLMQAIQRGNKKIAQLLIQKNADIQATTTDGYNALMYASAMRDSSILKTLLQQPNIDLQQTSIPTTQHPLSLNALSIAAGSGFSEHISLLLKNGADIDQQSCTGETALIHACRQNKTEIAELLLTEEANPLLRNQKGLSALRYATIHNNPKIVQMLLPFYEDIDGLSFVTKKENEENSSPKSWV